MPNAGIYAEYSNFDNNKGYTVANTGGGLLATSLGLETYFFSKIALGCNYQLPITQNLGEGMLKTNDRFMLNVSVLF